MSENARPSCTCLEALLVEVLGWLHALEAGGFPPEEGGQNFARIRSHISAIQKQRLNVWHRLIGVLRGDVMPNFTC
ncbi:hypothetical protein [Deinococcus sp. UYEF24]